MHSILAISPEEPVMVVDAKPISQPNLLRLALDEKWHDPNRSNRLDICGGLETHLPGGA